MAFRIVLDTNVWFSALGWRGAPHDLLLALYERQCVAVSCLEIFEELSAKLQSKLDYSRMESLETANYLMSLCEIVHIPHRVHVCADPDDDMILECAAVAAVDYIVTGDKRHLLPLKQYEGIPIITVRHFLDILQHQPS